MEVKRHSADVRKHSSSVFRHHYWYHTCGEYQCGACGDITYRRRFVCPAADAHSSLRLSLLMRLLIGRGARGGGDAAEAAQQIESIKQATAEEYQSEKTRVSMLEKTYGLWYRLESIWSNVSYFQRIVVFATQSALFVASVYFIEQGIITVGELVALNGYALMFFRPLCRPGTQLADHTERPYRGSAG